MVAGECYGKIRYSLSDESGILRFERFEIADDPGHRDLEQKLRAYLLNCSLAEVDLDYLRQLKCEGDSECTNDVINLIKEHQDLFARKGKNR